MADAPKSPCPRVAGSALARPFVQRLRSADCDGAQILALVREAEHNVENLHALSEIFSVAWDIYGKSEDLTENDLSDLSVKCMRMLCRVNPNEAREFHNRQRTYRTGGQADARMYEARATMEERLGDTAKAIKMLQEGLKVGAQPEEALRRQLKKLQPGDPSNHSANSSSFRLSVGTTPSRQQASSRVSVGTVGIGQQTPSRSSVGTVGIGQQTMLSKHSAIGCLSPDGTGGTPSRTRLSVASRYHGLACKSPARPIRILGLGLPERVLPGEGGGSDSESDSDNKSSGSRVESDARAEAASCDDKADLAAPAEVNEEAPEEDQEEEEEVDEAMEEEVEEEEEEEAAEEAEVEAEENCEEDKLHSLQESRLSTTLQSSTALTPIKEIDSAEEATAESALRTSESQASARRPGSVAPREIVNASTPLTAKHDASIHSDIAFATPVAEDKSEPTPSRRSKSIVVNGIPYTQIRVIGRGGSSKVYLVQSPTGETLALKRVTTDSAKQFEGFMNEVDLLMRLRGQQYVIQVVDAEVDKENGRILIVMEAGDIDLIHFLQSEQRLSLAKVQTVWRQMLEAVQVIHKARIVHSDLKPGNFVLVGGHLKVIDFGIAKGISNDTTNISRDASVGTLSYMAPEAVTQGQLKLGRSSDIWSLGIILYQMVYGEPPFAHLDPMQRLFLLQNPDTPITFPEGHCLQNHSDKTKAQLRDVLESCLQRDPRRRPSLDDLLAHPFLSSVIQVKRETVERAVTNVMMHITRSLGEAIQAVEPAPSAQALADEVWAQISDPDSIKEAAAFKSLGQLAVINSRFSSLQRERDEAIAEKKKLQEQIDKLMRQNAVQAHRILQPQAQGTSTNKLNGSQPLKAPRQQQRHDGFDVSNKENWNASIEGRA